jgi:hypothetical protein
MQIINKIREMFEHSFQKDELVLLIIVDSKDSS